MPTAAASLTDVPRDAPPAMVTAVPGPRSAARVEQLAAAECPALTTRRARRAEQSGAPHDPIVWQAARGCHVLDSDGNRYVDFSAGFGAAAVGHNHPAVVAAIKAQADTLLHALGDLQPSESKVELLTRLQARAPFADARVMLGLHGADAVEAALKTALLATGKPGVLAFEGGYHGLSHGPLALCGYGPGFRAPFAAQLNPHVVFAPYPAPNPGAAVDSDRAIAAVADAWTRAEAPIGAVVIEPILGRGGVVVPPPGFLQALASLCRERGALLVLDEVMTGLGRTGRWLCAAEEAACDLLCLGKALGGGQPVSACIGRAEVMAAWGDPGGEALHTATFLGNPLGCAAALSALDVLEQEALPARAGRVGTQLRKALTDATLGHPLVAAVRGEGLLLGVALRRPGLGLALTHGLLERGYITVPAAADASVLSLTPPLTLPEAHIPRFAEALVATLNTLSTRNTLNG